MKGGSRIEIVQIRIRFSWRWSLRTAKHLGIVCACLAALCCRLQVQEGSKALSGGVACLLLVRGLAAVVSVECAC